MKKSIVRALVYRFRGEYTTEKLVKMGLKVGQRFSRLNGVILDPAHCWLIEIGDDVTLAPRVHILAHDASTVHYLGYAKIGRVIIGNNVFIGADTVVLPNVQIGSNVIVGANSTVSRSLESGYVYAGTPAKAICTIEEYIEKNRKLLETNPCYGEEYTMRKKVNAEKKKQMNQELTGKCGFVK